jgi:hypothetical protein
MSGDLGRQSRLVRADELEEARHLEHGAACVSDGVRIRALHDR